MRILLFIFLTVFSIQWVSGQCIPDTSITHNDPGIYPDSATGLPHAIAGIAYSTVLQINVFTDTTSGPLTFTVDSIVVENVTGLPSGFSYQCTPATCSFPGGSNACVQLTGSPTFGMVGTYPITVQSRAYGYLTGGTPTSFADNNDDYKIVIDSTTGISKIESAKIIIGQNIPNPASNYALIPVTLAKPDEVTFTISNLIGKKVFTKVYRLQKGKTNIHVDLHGFQAGIYLYSFSAGGTTITRRMIISEN